MPCAGVPKDCCVPALCVVGVRSPPGVDRAAYGGGAVPARPKLAWSFGGWCTACTGSAEAACAATGARGDDVVSPTGAAVADTGVARGSVVTGGAPCVLGTARSRGCDPPSSPSNSQSNDVSRGAGGGRGTGGDDGSGLDIGGGKAVTLNKEVACSRSIVVGTRDPRRPSSTASLAVSGSAVVQSVMRPPVSPDSGLRLQ